MNFDLEIKMAAVISKRKRGVREKESGALLLPD